MKCAFAISGLLAIVTIQTTSVAVPQKSRHQLQIENKRFVSCRSQWNQAKRRDVLHDLKIDPLPPHMFVGPAFYTIPTYEKQEFADAVNCFLVGGEERYIDFDFLDYRTGRVAARYSDGRLEVDLTH
jgi:hypothetical protein